MDQVFFNGISAVTGRPMIDPMGCDDIANAALSAAGLSADIEKLVGHVVGGAHWGLDFNRDPNVLADAGWSIVLHADEDPAVREALEPLIAHRRTQAGDAHTILDYRDGETWFDWLRRHHVSPGSIRPKSVGYYVLIVGDPARIPFTFNYQADIEYAVGRLHFDSLDGYEAYAKSVVRYETEREVVGRRRLALWGPEHESDRATALSRAILLAPLIDGYDGKQPIAKEVGFEVEAALADQGTNAALLKALDSEAALIFTASHGIGDFPSGSDEQLSTQGALLTQDWPGFGKVGRDHRVAATDIDDAMNVHGKIGFHFACYGAGTPREDDFLLLRKEGGPPAEIAKAPFIAALPKRLLSHPRGGALAFVGHVERAWSQSFTAHDLGPQITPFRNALGRLMLGQTVGHALKDFGDRFATLSDEVSRLLELASLKIPVDRKRLGLAWLARNDARNYVIIGDPAVRLRVDDLVSSEGRG